MNEAPCFTAHADWVVRGPASERMSVNGATETDHISVGVGDGTLPLAVVLVSRAVDFDPRLYPLLGHPIGVLAVQIQRTVTRTLVSCCAGKVDREVSIPVSERIGVIVQRRLKARSLVPGDRTRHTGDLEDRLEPRDQPRPAHELQLTVALTVQAAEAVVADREIGVRAQSDPPINGHCAASTDHGHVQNRT